MGESEYGKGHRHSGGGESCCTSVPNPSFCQDINEMDFERGIWQAAIDGNTAKISNLINYGNVNPNATDYYGYTALHYAARNGKLSVAQALIRFGADVNCRTKNNGSTPLHRAALAGEGEMVGFLLDSGADMNALDADKLTPLERAKKEGKENIIGIFEAHSTKNLKL